MRTTLRSLLGRLLRRGDAVASGDDERVHAASAGEHVPVPNSGPAPSSSPGSPFPPDGGKGDLFHQEVDGWEVDRHIWDETHIRFFVASEKGVATIWQEVEQVFGKTGRREQGARTILASGRLGTGFPRLVKRIAHWSETVANELRDPSSGDDCRAVANGRLRVSSSESGHEFSLPPEPAASNGREPAPTLVVTSGAWRDGPPKWLTKLAVHLDPKMALLEAYGQSDLALEEDALSPSAEDPAVAEAESRWHPAYLFVAKDAALPAWLRLKPVMSTDPRLGEMLLDRDHDVFRVAWHRIGRRDALFAGRRDSAARVPGSFILAHVELGDFRGDHLAGPFRDAAPVECVRETDVPVWKGSGLNCPGNWIGLLSPLGDEERDALRSSAGSRSAVEDDNGWFEEWPRRG